MVSQAKGFHIRRPPEPHLLSETITKDENFFQTINMSAVDVVAKKRSLVIDGLVERPSASTFEQLLKFPSTTVQSTHSCFGSPLQFSRRQVAGLERKAEPFMWGQYQSRRLKKPGDRTASIYLTILDRSACKVCRTPSEAQHHHPASATAFPLGQH